jgi:hypothetical protein
MCAPDTLPLPPETTAPRASRRAPSGLGRRVTEPTLLLAPRISLEVRPVYLYVPRQQGLTSTLASHRLPLCSIYLFTGPL